MEIKEEELQKLFEQETGKHAIYRGNITKQYLTWRERKLRELNIQNENSNPVEANTTTTTETEPNIPKKNIDLIEKDHVSSNVAKGFCPNCGEAYYYQKGELKPNYCIFCGNQIVSDEEKRVFSKQEIKNFKKRQQQQLNGKKTDKSSVDKNLKENLSKLKGYSYFGKFEPILHLYARWMTILTIIFQLITLANVFSSADIWAAIYNLPSALTVKQAQSIIGWNIARAIIGGLIIAYLHIFIRSKILAQDYEAIHQHDLFLNKLPIKFPAILIIIVLFFFTAKWGGLILIPILFLIIFSPYRIRNWKNSPNSTENKDINAFAANDSISNKKIQNKIPEEAIKKE
ncbi:MAG: hypothetical protein ACTSRZ_18290 [Promethearchaeota archaeon]